jgi:hypothetical protein
VNFADENGAQTMTRSVLEVVLANLYEIQAVIGYRLAPDAPYIIIATFINRRDAEVFMAAADRSGEIGTYTLLNIED